MIRIEGTTKLPEVEVVNRLKRYFGKGGLGLEMSEQDAGCIRFEGGGGYLIASTCLSEEGTRLEIVTQEWEVQAKKFLSELPKKSYKPIRRKT